MEDGDALTGGQRRRTKGRSDLRVYLLLEGAGGRLKSAVAHHRAGLHVPEGAGADQSQLGGRLIGRGAPKLDKPEVFLLADTRDQRGPKAGGR